MSLLEQLQEKKDKFNKVKKALDKQITDNDPEVQKRQLQAALEEIKYRIFRIQVDKNSPRPSSVVKSQPNHRP